MRALMVRIAACAMVWALGTPPVAAQTPAIDEPTMIILVRNVMLALAHANQTGNFSVFRDLGSSRFQQENSTGYLTDRYAALRQNKIDLTPLAIVQPRFVQPSGLTPSGDLRATGFFPTQPYQVQFDMAFEKQAEGWRMSVLAIKFADAPPPVAAGAPANGGGVASAQMAGPGEGAGAAAPVRELGPALPAMPRLPRPRPVSGELDSRTPPEQQGGMPQ